MIEMEPYQLIFKYVMVNYESAIERDKENFDKERFFFKLRPFSESFNNTTQ